MFRSVAGEVCSGRPIRAVYLGSSLSSLLPSAAMIGGANVINPSSKNNHHAGAGVADPSMSYDQAPPHAPALPQFVTVKALDHRNCHRKRRQYQHQLVGVLDIVLCHRQFDDGLPQSGIKEHGAPPLLDGVARNVFLIIEKSGRHPRGIYAVIRWLVPFAVYEALVIQCKKMRPPCSPLTGSRPLAMPMTGGLLWFVLFMPARPQTPQY